jgi:hypothetical protein
VESYLLHPQSLEKVTLVLFSHFSTHHHFHMMDRPTSSANPLFEDQDEEHDYVTKNHFFITQRALHQESEALGDRIEQLATELRQSKARQWDYLDAKLAKQMDEFHNNDREPCVFLNLFNKTAPLKSPLVVIFFFRDGATSSRLRWPVAGRGSCSVQASPSRPGGIVSSVRQD